MLHASECQCRDNSKHYDARGATIMKLNENIVLLLKSKTMDENYYTHSRARTYSLF